MVLLGLPLGGASPVLPGGHTLPREGAAASPGEEAPRIFPVVGAALVPARPGVFSEREAIESHAEALC